MSVREQAIEAIKVAPEELVVEALDFLRFLAQQRRVEFLATAVASEPVLARDWDLPEEDEAWRSL
jgi:hypothetical protein